MWRDPVEHSSVEDNAVLVKGKLLTYMKHAEDSEDEQVLKARFVGLGNVLYNKRMRPRAYVKGNDFWAPVSSLAGARLVQIRGAAHRRLCESIDPITAYLQISLGGAEPYYIILEAAVLGILEPEDYAKFRQLEEPCCRLERALYGVGR